MALTPQEEALMRQVAAVEQAIWDQYTKEQKIAELTRQKESILAKRIAAWALAGKQAKQRQDFIDALNAPPPENTDTPPVE